MQARKKLTESQKERITYLASQNTQLSEIAKELSVDPRQVAGYVRTMINIGKGLPSMAGPRMMPPPTQEDLLKDLAKKWRESEPDAEFSMHTQKGQKVYIGAYKGGIVLKIGDQKKVAFLTANMGLRLGLKLREMAEWTRLP